MSTESTTPSQPGHPASETAFCPQCGLGADRGDRFCRSCGTGLEPPAPPPIPEGASNGMGKSSIPVPPAGKKRRTGRTVLALAGLITLMLAVAVGVLIAGGVLSFDSDSGAVATDTRTVENAMVDRDEFFTAERAYLGAYAPALGELRRYRRAESEFRAENKRIEEEFADEFDACSRYDDIACPEPDYPESPEAPNFGVETKNIRAAVQGLEELRVSLSSARPRGTAAPMRAQLVASVEAVKLEAEHNADVLAEAVDPPEGEAPGGVDNGKIKTLRKESALPAIREMNRAAVRLLRGAGLSLSRFDVPGGRDLDPKDHSDEA